MSSRNPPVHPIILSHSLHLCLLSSSKPRRHHMQLCRSSLCRVLISGLLLRSVHCNPAGVRTDLCGAAQTWQTHCTTTQTWSAHARRTRGRGGSSPKEGRAANWDVTLKYRTLSSFFGPFPPFFMFSHFFIKFVHSYFQQLNVNFHHI